MSEERKKYSGKKIAAGVVVGAISGIIAGVLLAPKKGKEIRKDFKRISEKIGKDVAEKAGEVGKLTEEKYSDIVKEASVFYKKAKKIKDEDLKEIVDNIKDRWPEVSEKLEKNKDTVLKKTKSVKKKLKIRK